MIVPMKRVAVLCLSSERDQTIDALSRVGVLHLTARVPPEELLLEEAHRGVWRAKRALEELPRHPTTPATEVPAERIVDTIWEIIEERRALWAEQEELRGEVQRIEPLGDFDPSMRDSLAKKGIRVRLFAVGLKQMPELPDDAAVEVVGRNGKTRYLAVVDRGDVEVDARELAWPERSLGELRRRCEEIDAQLQALEKHLASFHGDNERVANQMRLVRQAALQLESKAMMDEAGSLAYLRGFVPEDTLPDLRRSAKEQGWGLVVDDPKPDEAVPTLIRNPPWVRPIRVVFDFINILPGYREVDISALFLIFFGLFFSMIVGDAGYGVVYLLLTLAGWKFLPAAPKSVWRLLLVMSIGTIAWGLLTGNVFGIATLPATVENLRIPWLTDPNNVMLLCFLIGAIHLTLAHGWNAIQTLNSTRALAQLGWICTTWVMFAVARTMVLGEAFPSFMTGVLGAGVLLIVLFMTPVKRLKAEWFNHVMLPLDLISNFVDVVSYVRLFAVGMATFAMASAFNEMAGGMMGGFVGSLTGALLLFLGHTLNILLATMGVLVHGIRLNTLEFSGHLGLEWSGVRYDPLARDPKLKS